MKRRAQKIYEKPSEKATREPRESIDRARRLAPDAAYFQSRAAGSPKTDGKTASFAAE
jgi:hypothetical protein